MATAQGLLLDVLEVRFGGAPEPIVARIARREMCRLSAWLRIATTSDSIEDFVAALGTIAE